MISPATITIQGMEADRDRLLRDAGDQARARGWNGARLHIHESAGVVKVQLVEVTRPDLDAMPPKKRRAWWRQGVR